MQNALIGDWTMQNGDTKEKKRKQRGNEENRPERVRDKTLTLSLISLLMKCGIYVRCIQMQTYRGSKSGRPTVGHVSRTLVAESDNPSRLLIGRPVTETRPPLCSGQRRVHSHTLPIPHRSEKSLRVCCMTPVTRLPTQRCEDQAVRFAPHSTRGNKVVRSTAILHSKQPRTT